MEFEIGSWVMYSATGICRILSREKKCFDGVHETEYYKLEPLREGTHSVYYIPVLTAASKLRPLMDAPQVHDLIQHIQDLPCRWCADRNARKELCHQILRQDDPEQLLTMVKSLHTQQEAQSRAGKKLSSSDEAALHSAEQILNEEFALALHMQPGEIPLLVQQALHTTSRAES